MEYFDLSLNIEADNGQYTVHAQSETMGEAKGIMSFERFESQLTAAQERLAHGPVDRAFLMSFGGMLTEALLAGDVRDVYRESLGRVRGGRDMGVRIRLCIEPPQLAALPWELAYDRTRDTFLATSAQTPLTRYISLHLAIAELTITPPISVLVVIPDSTGLDVVRERAFIEDALSELRDAAKVTVLDGGVTRLAISEGLLAHNPHIFHFIGHGEFVNNDGYLKLNEAHGSGDDLIEAASFASFFRDSPSVKLVVLNSCQGATLAATRPLAGIAPQVVKVGIPAVVAMQYPFEDNPAVLFAREFYLKLCLGANRGRVDAAISHARNRLQMDFGDTPAFATPVLYMRSPTGVIFDLPAARTKVLPIEDIHRLEEVRKAHKTNIALLQESDTGGGESKQDEITKTKARIEAIDDHIRYSHRAIGGFILASWLVLFASWIGLFNAIKLDDWLERTFVGYMAAFVTTEFDRRVSLIVASGDAAENGPLGVPSAEWRCHHARLLSGLSAAGADVVAFDMYFEDASDCDEPFGEAIRNATAAGTAVVVGARMFDLAGGIPVPVMSPALSAAIQDQWGILEGSPVARRIRLAAPITEGAHSKIEQKEAGVVPSLALRALMHVEARRRGGGPLAAALARDHGVIRLRDGTGSVVRSIPVVDSEMNMIVAVASSSELAPAVFHEVLANAGRPDRLARFKGKIVLVGYTSRNDRWAISGGKEDSRYGVELQSSAISNLLRGVSIRPLATWAQYLIIIIMGLTGAFIGRPLRGRRRPAIAVRFGSVVTTALRIPILLIGAIVVYALVAFLVYKQYRRIFDISYHLASLLFVYGMVTWIQRGGADKVLAKRAEA